MFYFTGWKLLQHHNCGSSTEESSCLQPNRISAGWGAVSWDYSIPHCSYIAGLQPWSCQRSRCSQKIALAAPEELPVLPQPQEKREEKANSWSKPDHNVEWPLRWSRHEEEEMNKITGVESHGTSSSVNSITGIGNAPGKLTRASSVTQPLSLSRVPNPPPSSDVKALGIKATDLTLAVAPGVIYLNPAFPRLTTIPCCGSRDLSAVGRTRGSALPPCQQPTLLSFTSGEKSPSRSTTFQDFRRLWDAASCECSRMRIPELPRAVGCGG